MTRPGKPCIFLTRDVYKRQAIYPYLAYETLAKLVDSKAIDKPYRAVMLNYRNGINRCV